MALAPGQATPAALAVRMAVNPNAPAEPFNPVAAIKSILDAEKAPPAAAPAQPPPAPAAPEPEQPEPAQSEPQPDAPEGEPAPEGDAPAEPNTQTEGAEPASGASELPLEQLEAIELDVTIKGEDGQNVTRKLPVKELREGYMRQADYSRKTAEIARQREGVSEEMRKGVEGERAAYFQTLQTLQETVINTIDTELKDTNWSDLAENNPAEYVRRDNRRKQTERVLSEIQTKQQEIVSQRNAERAQARNTQAARSIEILEGKIPGWNDAHYQKLLKAAVTDYGYKPDEAASWVDHRAFEILHDAFQFRQLKAQKGTTAPVTTKKVVVPPRVVTPGPAAPATAAKVRSEESMKKLQKSGTIQDAAAVIKSRMG